MAKNRCLVSNSGDLVVASEGSRFTLAYGAMGLSPEGGISWHLTRALGRNQALALLLSNDTLTGTHWAALGLAHKLVPTGQSLTEALAWADALAVSPIHVLASIKELVHDAADHSLQTQLLAEQRHFMVNLSRQDAGQAMARLMSKKAD